MNASKIYIFEITSIKLFEFCCYCDSLLNLHA